MKNRISICSSLLVLALTMLLSASAQAQAFNPIRITGPVTAFTPSDCGKAGSITIANVTVPIAAGAEVSFVDNMQVFSSNGGLTTANVVSEVWQVLNTVRTLFAYLDPQGRVRLQPLTTLPLPAATTPAIDFTGVVAQASPLTINGYTFTLSGTSLPAVVSTTPTRIVGTLNLASNQLTITNIVQAYRKLTVCGAPALSFSSGVGLVGDANSFDADGPIAGSSFIFNPLGTAAGLFLCDQSVEVMRVDGATNIIFAPNFSIRQDISKDVNACYELNMDSFGWASNGSVKTNPASPKYGTVQGAFDAFRAATTSFPTNNNEANQQGRITLSGVTFVVASGVTVPLNGATANGQTVCLNYVVDPTGQTAPFLTGQQAPPRAGQLINGTSVKPGTCP